MKKLVLFLLIAPFVVNAQATLVADIGKGNNGCSGGKGITFKNHYYMTADDGNGSKLWRTDGTEAGTEMFKSFLNGANTKSSIASVQRNFFIMNNHLYFIAYNNATKLNALYKTDGENTSWIYNFESRRITFHDEINKKLILTAGQFLFATDGTNKGTKVIKNTPVFGNRFVKKGNEIYFSCTLNRSQGNELFKTDGTRAGTVLVKDIHKGSRKSSYPNSFTVLNNKVYFSANNGTVGNELWETDGTEAGTKLVKDITTSGNTFSYNDTFLVLNNKIYFKKGSEIWETNGTSAGTKKFADVGGRIKKIISVNNKIVAFYTIKSDRSQNIWLSDGTTTGTKSFKVNTSEFFHTGAVEVVGEKIFFQATNSFGYEIWVSNLTAKGTYMVKDILPTWDDGHIRNIASFKGKAIFLANDGWRGYEYWTSDGTEAGTTILKDINKQGYLSANVNDFYVFKNDLFFTANNGKNGLELWKLDGKTPVMLKDINKGNLYSNPKAFVTLNDYFYFFATSKDKGRELWKSDGTKAGTTIVKDINPNEKNGCSSYNNKIAVLNNKLYFFANDGTHGFELWESDGTEAGTKMVKDINPGLEGSNHNNEIVVFKNKLYFSAHSGDNDYELWTSNGTEGKTKLLKNLNPKRASRPKGFVPFSYKNELYFTANTTDYNNLWKTDGTEAGTVRIGKFKNVSNLTLSGVTQDRQGNKTYKIALYFSGINYPQYGNELYVVTKNTVQLVKDVNPGTSSSYPNNLFDNKGQLFFVARDKKYRNSLWKANGYASAEIVKDVGGRVTDFVSFGNQLIFGAGKRHGSEELWVSDGTSEGTKLFQEINTSEKQGSVPRNFFVKGNTLYFSANDGTHGAELWKLENLALSTKEIAQKESSKLTAFPLPTNGVLNLQVPNQTIQKASVYNILGKKVLETINKGGLKTINLQNLNRGMYILKINTESTTFSKKIIKN